MHNLKGFRKFLNLARSHSHPPNPSANIRTAERLSRQTELPGRQSPTCWLPVGCSVCSRLAARKSHHPCWHGLFLSQLSYLLPVCPPSYPQENTLGHWVRLWRCPDWDLSFIGPLSGLGRGLLCHPKNRATKGSMCLCPTPVLGQDFYMYIGDPHSVLNACTASYYLPANPIDAYKQ